MIVIDDYSTDGTDQVVQSWSLNDERIRYYKLPRNSGSPVFPRNVGVDLAAGKYIAFLDSDDIWHKEKLEIQVGYMQTVDGAISYHDLLVKYPDGKTEKWSKLSTPHAGWCFENLLKKNFMATSSVMLRRDLYRVCGHMDENLNVSHDWDLWLKIAADYEVHYIPDILGGHLNIHHGSVITEVHKRRKESRKVIRKWLPYIEGSMYRKIIAYYYVMEIFDVLPKQVRDFIRNKWYKQERYK